ncbi:MAG: hypothetical protein JEZ12_03590 [Desulfobacterium sp.]|nr:hypothetical protein [Desulfobacterium sp.]
MSINGAAIHTTCREYTMGEELKLTDIKGTPLLISDIPLPCKAVIESKCLSGNCSLAVSITVDLEVKSKTQPE